MRVSARYDAAAEFYISEVGDGIDDEGTAGLLELLGDVRGRDLLDVACGHGRITREIARRGAQMTGVDLSAALIANSRQRERLEPLGIAYEIGDVGGLRESAPGRFDGVVCNFGLSDIDDLDAALGGVAWVLRTGGFFVCSILHPCFPGWGPARPSSWQPGQGYFREGWWRAEAAPSRIRRAVGSSHRMLSTYVNAMTGRGLLVERVHEPLPPAAWLTAEPDADLVPVFLAVRCRRVLSEPA
jgi:ubiquinone/menaquinone biosynthesis C-methylase UbiE